MEIQYLKPTDINKRYENHPGPYIIGDNELNKIFPDILKEKIQLYYNKVHGELDDDNIILINKLVSYLKPRIILEIGTFRGRTTMNMLKNSPSSKIITIDTIKENVFTSGMDKTHIKSNLKYKSLIDTNEICCICNDSLFCSHDLDCVLNGESIDFAFIDGNHSYTNVSSDFEKIVMPRLSDNGVVVFDDYNNLFSSVGVTMYLLQKAYYDRYVFYWYKPKDKKTNEVIFVNHHFQTLTGEGN